MSLLDIYCVTNKKVSFLNEKKINYKIGWVGKEQPELNYIFCNKKDNIFYKEKYYSELTFHYWYWKNILSLKNKNWIGFCQKRRFWVKSESKNIEINKKNIQEHILTNPEKNWNNYEAIICNPINISGSKKIKIFKRGFRSLIKDPSILWNLKKENILLHFDMHHGYGNLDKAINLLDASDSEEFRSFVHTENSFNPHIMFISKSDVANEWFKKLFNWLERCEAIFGFKELSGYDTSRLYAYLAERYLSFWFKKYTTYKEQPWVFIDN